MGFGVQNSFAFFVDYFGIDVKRRSAELGAWPDPTRSLVSPCSDWPLSQ